MLWNDVTRGTRDCPDTSLLEQVCPHKEFQKMIVMTFEHL